MSPEMVVVMQYSTPVLILFLLFYVGKVDSKMDEIKEDMKEIKSGITWGDTCRRTHEDIDRRLGTLERKTGLNGNAGE